MAQKILQDVASGPTRNLTKMEFNDNLSSIFLFHILYYMNSNTPERQADLAQDSNELPEEASTGVESPEFLEALEAATKPEQKSLGERLMWQTITEEFGEGPYRSVEQTRRERTKLGKVVGFIQEQRKAFTAVGVVAALGLGVKTASPLFEHAPESPAPITIPHRKNELVTPFVNVGGVNMNVDPNHCFSQSELNCQIDLGGGPRPMNPKIDPAQIAISSFKLKK